MAHPDNPHLGTDKKVSETWRPKMSKDPHDLLALKLIPPHLLKYIPKEMRFGPPSANQKAHIRVILNMRERQVFKRCRGTKKDGKPCGQVAGEGTKGDFYGIGGETGTLGVGFCSRCIMHHHILPGLALQIARNEVEKMQHYGTHAEDEGYSQEVAKREVALAEQGIKVRKSVRLAYETVERLQHQLKIRKREETELVSELKALREDVKTSGADGKIIIDCVDKVEDMIMARSSLTEYAGGKLQPLSFKSEHDMLMNDATILSKLDLDDNKLDNTKFILVDIVRSILKECEQAKNSGIRLTSELTTCKLTQGDEGLESGDTPIVDYVIDTTDLEWRAIVKRMQKQIGQG